MWVRLSKCNPHRVIDQCIVERHERSPDSQWLSMYRLSGCNAGSQQSHGDHTLSHRATSFVRGSL